jgi:hypothetical protein
MGAMRETMVFARRALLIQRKTGDRSGEACSLYFMGELLSAQGVVNDSQLALQRSVRIFERSFNQQYVGIAMSDLAARALWFGDGAYALSLANSAWKLAGFNKNERDFIRAARLQGEAALALDNLTTADERLHYALTRARTVNYVEEELYALLALAELRQNQRNMRAAHELLDDVWEAAERGPYPLIHADACNVLAKIGRDEGNTSVAVEAATKAYRLAWCDGPPFAYHWGLEKAKKHLKELGAPEPEMPPFDESKFEPMPEVEIDPDDEFHVGNASDTSEG